MPFFIIRFYNRIYTLIQMTHPTANPNWYQWRGKTSTQNVKLPIKHYDMVRKVTGCTSCLLLRVIKKISSGHGHRCSRLTIFTPIFFT